MQGLNTKSRIMATKCSKNGRNQMREHWTNLTASQIELAIRFFF
jgi:hypothetical protein